jgi:hypothetical protein
MFQTFDQIGVDDWNLLIRAKRNLGLSSTTTVDVAVGGSDHNLGFYPEEIRNKLRMLAGPHGKTIWKMMQVRNEYKI